MAISVAASQTPLPLPHTHLPIPMAHPAATGPLSPLPMAFRLAHGVRERHPDGPLPIAVVDSVASVLAVLSDSVVDLVAGAPPWVVHSAEETGAPVLSPQELDSQAVHGQSGGTETSAQLPTGLAGLPEAGRPAHHGPLGPLALLQSPLLPSTPRTPRLSEPSVLTPPPALVTRSLRLPQPALALQALAPPAVLRPSPLQVVRQLQHSWDSLPCYKRNGRPDFCNKINVLM